MGVARSNSGTRSTSAEAPTPAANVASGVSETTVPPPAAEPVEQMPLDKAVKDLIDKYIHNLEEEEAVSKAQTLSLAHNHTALIGEIFNIALEK